MQEPGFELRQHGVHLHCILPLRVRWPLRVLTLFAAVLPGGGAEEGVGDWRPPSYPVLMVLAMMDGMPRFAS